MNNIIVFLLICSLLFAGCQGSPQQQKQMTPQEEMVKLIPPSATNSSLVHSSNHFLWATFELDGKRMLLIYTRPSGQDSGNKTLIDLPKPPPVKTP